MIINIQKERLTDGSSVYNLLLCQSPSEGGNLGCGEDEAVITIYCVNKETAYQAAIRIEEIIKGASNECPRIVESVKP